MTLADNAWLAGDPDQDGLSTWRELLLEATDPLGATEHLEFRWEHAGFPSSVPAAEVPAGFGPANTDLHRYNTVYWDRRAWARADGEVAAATVTHWLLDAWRTQQASVPAGAGSPQQPPASACRSSGKTSERQQAGGSRRRNTPTARRRPGKSGRPRQAHGQGVNIGRSSSHPAIAAVAAGHGGPARGS